MELWWSIFVSVVFVAVGIHYKCIERWNYFRARGIFHIPPLPLIGNMAAPLFRRKPLAEHLNDIYNLRKDAKYVGFYEFMTPMIMLRDKDLIKAVTIKNFDHFENRLGLASRDVDPFFGNILFSIHGDEWRELRANLTPLFTTAKIKAIFNLMNDYSKTFVEKIAERCVNGSYAMDTKDAFARFTNDVTASAIFGVVVDSLDEPRNEFYTLGKRATSIDGSASIKYVLSRNFPFLAKFLGINVVSKDSRDFFYSLVKRTIDFRAKHDITRPDMIQLMMQVNSNRSEPLSNELMASLAFGFYFGGLDTTSTLQCFVARMIAAHKDVHERIQAEVDKMMEENNGVPTYESINRMEYLEAVILETMRFYPPVSFIDRICTRPFELPASLPGGKPVSIAPGTCIWIPSYSIHRDSRFHENPETFDPERFIGRRRIDIDPITFIPFGAGPRMCTGNRFAMIECKIIFTHLLHHCTLKIPSNTRVPLKLATNTVLMAIDGGSTIQLDPRHTIERHSSFSSDRT